MREHPHLHLLEEPFNENFVKWFPERRNYLSSVRDTSTLDACVADILAEYDGFKHLAYQLDGEEDLLEHLLLMPEFIVVLIRRRNLLQTAVSAMIAHQTGIWGASSLKASIEEHYADLEPLDCGEVEDRIEWLASQMDWCESVLDRRGADVLRLVYEDFYYAHPEDQAEQVQTLWDFIGVSRLPSANFDHHLRPELAKLNSHATYSMVPNIDEVDRRCGSDLHGWLFTDLRGSKR